jgi:hypothetical protein
MAMVGFVAGPRGDGMSGDDQHVSLGEVYRLCQSIEAKVNAQNGRVSSLELHMAVLKDRGEQAKDSHARGAGWGGVLIGAISLWWTLFHGGRP